MHKYGWIAVAIGSVMGASQALASVNVSWTSPANNSTAAIGSIIAPSGVATSGGSTGGSGLDLVLVLDSSGSMTGNRTAVSPTTNTTVTQSLRLWQQEIATTVVNNLPTGTTSVGVVEFDSFTSTVQTLLPLTSAANTQQIINAINSVDSSGGTNVASGINRGVSELNTNGTAGRSGQLLVFSDGDANSGTVSAAAAAAAASYVVNTVALPGSAVSVLESVANTGNGFFANGTVAGGLEDLFDLFDGTGGTPVGIADVSVTNPDGSMTSVPVDIFTGAFSAPGYAVQPGNNLFSATVTGDDGSMNTSTLNVIGAQSDPGVVPEPGTIAIWSVIALAGLGVVRRCE